MYCQRCQQFQDDVGALISEDRLHPGTSQTDIDDDVASGQAPTAPLYLPSHSIFLFNDLEELRAAYNSPCPLCRRVFRCIDRGDWASLKTFKSVRIVLTLDTIKNKHVLTARFDTDPPMQSVRRLGTNPVKSTRKLQYLGEWLEGLEDEDPLLKTLQECASLENTSTGSKASIEMTKFWLNECLTRHPDCARDTSGWLPTRVIDVGDADGDSSPRLVETADLSPPSPSTPDVIPFVALSHCWGTKQIITTTASTLADRKCGIDLHDLSKTFRDAVMTTRRLGLRYLWIDSLCIIQDSVEDWMLESVQMCTVYERALFTIMATHASGGDEGCFVKRDGLAQLPLTLRFTTPDKSRSLVACFHLPDHGQGLRPRYLPVLFTRAWVLQEQFNSRARLIFFGEQIHWECRTMSGSEERPLHGKRIWDMVSGPGSLAVDHQDGSSEESHYSLQWYELVKNYTRRGITKSSDRLIAIDGIAQSLQKRTSDRYIAGLWAETLSMGLMWYMPWTLTKSGPWHAQVKEAKTHLSSRHERALAPTWSWASVTFPVDWFSLQDNKITITYDVLQAHAHGSPFDTSGILILRGMTRRLFVRPYYQRLHFTGSSTKNPYLRDLDAKDMKTNDKWQVHICYASHRPPSRLYPLAPLPMEFFPDAPFDHTQPVTFIALGHIPAISLAKTTAQRFSTLAMTSSQRSIYTLALQATADDPSTFRRVGIAIWNNCSWFGYFCVSEASKPSLLYQIWQVQESNGLIAMLKEILELVLVWLWATLLGQAIARFRGDGHVWFRELARGNAGRHGHDGDIKSKATYRKGCEAEERTVRVV